MAFQDIMTVEESDFYIEIAFNAVNKAAKIRRTKLEGGVTDKAKSVESVKLDAFSDKLTSTFEKIEKSFPSFDELSEFYQELLKIFVDYDMLKKSLASLKWVRMKIVLNGSR